MSISNTGYLAADSSKLPDKLSDYIELAVEDAKKCEADNRYDLYMNRWHDPGYHNPDDKCLVCLGGSVMAQTLEAPIDEDVRPGHYERAIRNKLYALDCVRLGNLHSAALMFKYCDYNEPTRLKLGEDETEKIEPIKTELARTYDRQQYRCSWEGILEAAKQLRAIGL